jgi:hypothetical protein
MVLLLSLLLIVFFEISFLYNKHQVKPTVKEVVELKKFYQKLIRVKSQHDIIILQNFTIDKIKHEANGINEIDIVNTIKVHKGKCFNRSMLMQKALIYNGIPIRPVFLFSNPLKTRTSIFDFFSTNITTHNIFEYYMKDEWFIMETNFKMFKPLSLNEYLKNQKYFKIKPRYIRFLNNRNGRFIKPNWVPDIYCVY